MTRRLLAILALVAAVAVTMPPASAAPVRQSAPVSRTAPDEDLPVPPIPPADQPQDTAAPVPDVDIAGPPAPLHEGPELKPVLDSRPPPLPGADPVPGTLYRSDLEQKRQFVPNPGIQFVVPIQK